MWVGNGTCTVKRPTAWAWLATIALLSAPAWGAEVAGDDAARAVQREAFERQVRPLLAEHCYGCHGPEKQEGGLRLDRHGNILRGGESGPAVVPGDADASPLIQAVRYEGLEMPPDGKLSGEQVAMLARWVSAGAIGPDEGALAVGSKAAVGGTSTFDLEERRRHWAYQPVQEVAVPAVRDTAWPAHAVDAFLLARMEAAGLAPNPPADRRTLIRRLTFDLWGLPPSREEVAAFLADESPEAWPRLIERLIQSPHYGERWARHWLDLMRFSETLGHEFDYDLFHAWRYRDYVIRAFYQDVPYTQLVLEHLAGDLLPEPRRDATTGLNESVVATGWWWFGEAKHSPVDVRLEETDRIDNQLDVLGKAFLGQTVACARCHDHKFDAIPSRDYYALAGYVKSSRYQQAYLDDPARWRPAAAQIRDLKRRLGQALARDLGPTWQRELQGLSRVLSEATVAGDATDRPDVSGNEVDESAARWRQVLEDDTVGRPEHPLYVARGVIKGAGWEAILSGPAATKDETKTVMLADPQQGGTRDWIRTGPAYDDSGIESGSLLVDFDCPERWLRLIPTGWCSSAAVSTHLEGDLRSPTFRLSERYLHLRVAGRRALLNVVVDGFNVIRDPVYGSLSREVNGDDPQWVTIDLEMWRGHRAYIEWWDSTTPGLSQAFDAGRTQSDGRWGTLVEARLSSSAEPPTRRHGWDEELRSTTSVPEVARSYPRLAARALARWMSEFALGDRAAIETADRATAADLEFLDHCFRLGLLTVALKDNNEITDLLAELKHVEEALPLPARAPALADGTGEDECLLARGNYRMPGEVVPRACLSVLGGGEPADPNGSGRLELAHRLVAVDNPLLARVMANRVWQHRFGRGLVATPDDFGRMGEAPSHAELLDYLAGYFVEHGWSIQALDRLLLTSRAYQMASQPSEQATASDPANRWWSHMPRRRMEGEAIRDGILAVCGSLNPQPYGPGVAPYLTPFMEGTGRPAQSGPLDGGGRRSIYLTVRRNFLSPLLSAFDYPLPASAMGRRNVSNVPAQALALLNDPFVTDQARRWGTHCAGQREMGARERMAGMMESAWGRPPREEELQSGVQFLDEQARLYGVGGDDPAPWSDLGHVLLNSKEFLFID